MLISREIRKGVAYMGISGIGSSQASQLAVQNIKASKNIQMIKSVAETVQGKIDDVLSGISDIAEKVKIPGLGENIDTYA